jgi:hypothetical protein
MQIPDQYIVFVHPSVLQQDARAAYCCKEAEIEKKHKLPQGINQARRRFLNDQKRTY